MHTRLALSWLFLAGLLAWSEVACKVACKEGKDSSVIRWMGHFLKLEAY